MKKTFIIIIALLSFASTMYSKDKPEKNIKSSIYEYNHSNSNSPLKINWRLVIKEVHDEYYLCYLDGNPKYTVELYYMKSYHGVNDTIDIRGTAYGLSSNNAKIIWHTVFSISEKLIDDLHEVLVKMGGCSITKQ